MKEIVSNPSTLLQFLTTFYPDSSNRTLRNILQAGRITVNGKSEVRAALELKGGEEVELHETSRKPTTSVLPILFEDEHLIIINKPDGLLSVPLDSNKGRARNVLGILRQKGADIFPVHRLDRKTSGAILFAKTKEAQDKLGEMFKEHLLDREYFAVVNGELKEESGTWQGYLEENKNLDMVSNNKKKGKEAITHFEVLKRTERVTHLRLRLETGRKHQIRVHCMKAGHPVLGDERYGDAHSFKRLALHAQYLSFEHPITGESVSVHCPPPNALTKLR